MERKATPTAQTGPSNPGLWHSMTVISEPPWSFSLIHWKQSHPFEYGSLTAPCSVEL